ncbi:3,4-dihydroxy-2-butanone 4-phosphate synthase [candidate division MSBL1 archaeon SCGC-AAA382F02]|uniref:3,4-dihydroxy-2-butanone 4-phosphate synthase n=1 Tax=candidate division MSBL1 archaeon SCGC-AAA382F02 TaxID=1698282 RepID=A0A133VI71_9EURY|nr:3,4-dihydroxy-2-butanone 4-phosphate synthase [candidate division MSBL1 archaeon SCGC-AAA382F02]
MSVEKAIEKLQSGEFVLIHDSSEREDETDMVIAAENVRPIHVAQMRQDAGGLICVAVHPKVANELNLPYMSRIYEAAAENYEILNSAEADDLPYDERSAFSISVNHRDTFTGITDADRALTIKKLGELSTEVFNGSGVGDFGKKFRTPGHIPLLRADDDLLESREGHTEFSVVLAEMAGVSPAVAVCEMMDSETKRALNEEKAEEYAEEKSLVFLEGDEILEAYRNNRRSD